MTKTQIVDRTQPSYMPSRKSSCIYDINLYQMFPENYSGKPQLDFVYNPLNLVIKMDRNKIHPMRKVEIHNRRVKYTDFRKKRLKRFRPNINNHLAVGSNFHSPIFFNINDCISRLGTKSLFEEITTLNRSTHEENIEHDVFVKMPPVKKWTARVRIKSIENAKMHIVEP